MYGFCEGSDETYLEFVRATNKNVCNSSGQKTQIRRLAGLACDEACEFSQTAAEANVWQTVICLPACLAGRRPLAAWTVIRVPGGSPAAGPRPEAPSTVWRTVPPAASRRPPPSAGHQRLMYDGQ